ncbi:SDR family NAD(P)-dependent oxidoreductase [Pusillimonas noertemannii]|uniref:3-oxoacyl-[acyl-carrier protein] reductase n=1 Tax=Pusillimonas noertemannii TaxID=305977 RepID=A0A2U1CST5_9BURK|nr:SDR family NAD(P)-dependent oxidoreductase [Pusillimonas noertemannii]NYT70541.1 SDR family oxidoreductase [Pusillimonas noertemannii]PVY68948.1 3-oxoacyl-[acyl-carrier protein] reductase [Pusillimonas noertemannii]
MSTNSQVPNSSRVVVVTGAAQGIGRAYVKEFCAQGYRVAALDINAKAVNQVAAEASGHGGHCLPFEVDVGDEASVASACHKLLEQLGSADILVNNAAIFSTLKMRPFEEIPLDEWTKVLHVNITGTLLMVKALLPSMRQRKWGRIINVSSAAVTMGRPHYLHYTTSKAAVIGMTRSMARELGVSGITVNALLPGAIDTEISRETVTPAQKQAQIDMRSVPREATPQDLTGVVSFLASEASGFVTGQSLIVDGGLTFL